MGDKGVREKPYSKMVDPYAIKPDPYGEFKSLLSEMRDELRTARTAIEQIRLDSETMKGDLKVINTRLKNLEDCDVDRKKKDDETDKKLQAITNEQTAIKTTMGHIKSIGTAAWAVCLLLIGWILQRVNTS